MKTNVFSGTISLTLLVCNGLFAQKQYDIMGSMNGITSRSVKLAVYHEDDRTQKDIDSALITNGSRRAILSCA